MHHARAPRYTASVSSHFATLSLEIGVTAIDQSRNTWYLDFSMVNIGLGYTLMARLVAIRF